MIYTVLSCTKKLYHNNLNNIFDTSIIFYYIKLIDIDFQLDTCQCQHCVNNRFPKQKKNIKRQSIF